MFAYCNNNPVSFADESGTAARTCLTADVRIDDAPWREYSPGVGGLSSNNYSSGNNYGSVADKFYTARLFKFLFNSDEQVVLNAEHFAFYKGQLVIRQNWAFTNGRSGSFLIMFLNKDVTDINVVKHEWGHFAQLLLLGAPNYIASIAIPSVTSDPYDPYYYSNPWERTADWLGRVKWDDCEYREGSLMWGLSQFVLGPVSVPLFYIFGK